MYHGLVGQTLHAHGLLKYLEFTSKDARPFLNNGVLNIFFLTYPEDVTLFVHKKVFRIIAPTFFNPTLLTCCTSARTVRTEPMPFHWHLSLSTCPIYSCLHV